jgi:signal transduction histidine kinase
MYVSGSDGLYAFYPEQIEGNLEPPPIVITAFDLFNQRVRRDLPADEHIQLTYQENFVSFEFAALDYAVPEKNQYAYIMEGLDGDWIYAGARRRADYPDLEPGEYVFRVKGSNNDGVWNEEGVAVYITITPPFWDTWWFRGIVVLALVVSGVLGYRLRVQSVEARSRELERQVEVRTAELLRETEQRAQAEEALRRSEMEKAVAAERSRLARELHDAVTQTLFSASLIAEVLPRVWATDPARGHRQLEEVRLLARGALAEMRALLLELRPDALSRAKMGDLLSQLGRATIGRTGVSVVVTVEGEQALPPEVQVALYRVAQEALNNAGKHAEASQVNVRFACEPGRAELCISDDGQGFDVDGIPPGHFGVGIMQERAAAIGAVLEIESQPRHGTKVMVVWAEGERRETKDEGERNA